jgi:leader peptidase (prepilin peptidase)/N-methyltransferase
MESGGSLIAGLVFVFGACVGSFAGVVAYRLPRDISITSPRSFCPNCRALIPAWANIPIISWFVLCGRCARCHNAIGFRVLLTELALGAAAIWLYLNFSLADAFARFVFCTALFVIALIDYDWRVIHTAIPGVGIPLGFVAATFVMPEIGWRSSLLGIIGGAGFLALTAFIYRAIRGVEGVGTGDIYLLGMAGAFIGWPGALFTLFTGSLFGSIGGVALALAGSPASTEPVPEAIAAVVGNSPDSPEAPLLRTAVPFGPFLAFAAGIYALFQPQLLDWYLGR